MNREEAAEVLTALKQRLEMSDDGDYCYYSRDIDAYDTALTALRGWVRTEDRLPEKPKYDWVLVRVRLVPEGWYGVPLIAELRDGVWYADCYDTPLEETAGVKVTHWMPLPEVEG